MTDILDYSLDALENLALNFQSDLLKSEQGIPTDFAFFKHSLPEASYVAEGELFQVVSIGGSNLETAIARNESGSFSLGEVVKKTLPLLNSKDIFLESIYPHISPEITTLILNFAYPIEPVLRDNRIDGRLLKATKEHSFDGLVGGLVGEALEKRFAQQGQTVQVICANDVVCLTLASTSENTDLLPQNLVSMVLGTGNNFGLFSNQGQIVNLESGNFKNFEQTPSGKDIDLKSKDVGQQLLEKEIAGRYLHHHFNYYSDKEHLGIELQEAREVNELAATSNPGSELARSVVLRSAGLVAAILKGIWLYKNKNKLVCTAEGSMYWHGFNFPQNVNSFLTELQIPPKTITFNKVHQSNLVGAAELALFRQN